VGLRDGWNRFWDGFYGAAPPRRENRSGQYQGLRERVTGAEDESAPPSGLATAFAIVNFLSNVQGSLPRKIVEVNDPTRKVTDPEFRFLLRRPNVDWRKPSVHWWINSFAYLEGWRNLYVWRDNAAGETEGLFGLHPSRVEPFQDELGRARYRLDGKKTPVYTPDDILHIPGISFDGVAGISPVRAGLQTHRHAHLLDLWGYNFLRRGISPAVIVSTQDELDDDATKEFYKRFREQHSGPRGAGGAILVQGGNQIERLVIPPDEAQFLESKQHTREEVLGYYAPGLPHHMLGWKSNTSNFGTGVEAQARHLVQFVLMTRLALVESAINDELLPDGLEFKFELQHLLRGDTKTMAEVFKKMREQGVLSADQWLAEFGMPPRGIPDDYLIPKNTTRILADTGEPAPVEEPQEPAAPPPGPPEGQPMTYREAIRKALAHRENGTKEKVTA